ncbi:Protein of unknown function [Puniceibacterium sediminis]|uniref:DUF262 domain-containing protein n=2 Tax=Puniceibacterium sediminis TaxID=1608407 RepID=A0A238Z5S7_9RHOB|nr:Protein of unknown function [Puniceibacterium sediminis]
MPATTFSTSNDTYKQLLAGGGVFQIPRFQRDYSWTEENWEDLWSDIDDLMQGNDADAHYMGYLVLQPKPDRTLDIIDGQQRMTTLSLLVLSGMRKIRDLVQAGIDPANNETRLGEIRRTYIGQIDTVSLSVDSKITLNRNNDDYYQTYLTTLRDMPARGFKASEHLMRKATEWFQRRLNEYLVATGRPEVEHGVAIAELIDTVSRGLFFTVITVDDELNAYKVFETLNARGVKLAAPDLLKNYLFSLISRDTAGAAHDRELDQVERRWSDILERLQSENITAYLRTYWGANHAFVRQSELFKVIKRSIADREQAYRLITGLEDGVETYLSLTQPDQSGWAGEDRENAKLLKLFSVRQPFALLMAMQDKIPEGFSQVLSGIVNITFRYNAISNLQANEQERTYSRVAIGISQGSYTSAAEVLRELRSIYPNDEVFRANFSVKAFDTSNNRNKQIVRYILAKIDAQNSQTAYVSPPSEISVEHILPENPADNWPLFSETEAASSVYRLGNMMLLEESLNRRAGNLAFIQKKPLYADSNLLPPSQLAIVDWDWDGSQIENRQRQLAIVATGIWRVSQLHP